MGLVEALGAVVKERRIQQGLSQERLAELAEVHVNFVSLIERGQQAMSVTSLESIANALDTKPSKLLVAAERRLAAE